MTKKECPECEVCETNDFDVKTRYTNFIKTYKETRDVRNSNSQEQIYYVYNVEEYGFRNVKIDINGNATIYFESDSTLGKKYPDGYEVPEKVFYAAQVFYGNVGCMILFS